MEIFRTIENESNLLPQSQRLLLEKIALGIHSIVFQDDISDDLREKRLTDIADYLSKKSRRSKHDDISNQFEYIRFVRNSIAHGSAVAPEVLDMAVPIFWGILAESAPQWNKEHLSNLLSYALRRKNNPLRLDNGTSKNMVRNYERTFMLLPQEEKRSLFRDLLLNIYTSEEFQKVLEKNKRSKSKERVK